MKKLLAFAFAAFTVFFSKAQYNSGFVKQYIDTYKELAINEMIRTGVPASITLAQGILETQAGQCDLLKQSNNHFGIKCKTEWQGNVVYHDDDLKGECFRSYACAADSYKDHSDFLKTRPNYAFLFKLDPTDYEGWAKGLKKAGYATNPKYSFILMKIIVDNNLQDYTLTALERMQNPQDDYAANNVKPLDNIPVLTDASIASGNVPLQSVSDKIVVAQTVVAAPTYPTSEFEINNTKVVFVAPGTSLFALANNYNISYKKLLEYNELTNQDILSSGQLIYLAKKPKQGAADFHIVLPNETMESIAQTEGMRLQNLIEYNLIPKGTQPAVGEKLNLKVKAAVPPKLVLSNATAINN